MYSDRAGLGPGSTASRGTAADTNRRCRGREMGVFCLMSGPGCGPGKDTPRVEVTLVAVKADGAQRELAMKRARMVVGRKKECDLRIPDPSVSREHCEIRVENGKVLVKDLGSSNGTYVNRERVQESEITAGQLLG